MIQGLAYGGMNLTNGGVEGAFFRAQQERDAQRARIDAALSRLDAIPYGEIGNVGYGQLRSACQLRALRLDNWDEFMGVWGALPAIKNGRDRYDLTEMLLLGKATPAEVRALMEAADVTVPWYGR